MAKKKKIEIPKQTYIFEIGSEEYDSNLVKFKRVFLNKKEIFQLSFETFMGHRRDQTKELLAALSAEIGKEVTKDHLSRAMKLGIIEI